MRTVWRMPAAIGVSMLGVVLLGSGCSSPPPAQLDPCPGELTCPNGVCCPVGYPFDCGGKCYPTAAACGASYTTCSGKSGAGGAGAGGVGGAGGSGGLGGGGVGGGSGGAGPSNVFTFVLDGQPYDWSAQSYANPEYNPSDSEVYGDAMSGQVGSLVVRIPPVPPGPGLYDCTTPGVEVGLVDPVGEPSNPNAHDSWTAAYNIASSDNQPSTCSVTIASFGGNGQPYTGTFNAELARAGTTTRRAITQGHFSVIWSQP